MSKFTSPTAVSTSASTAPKPAVEMPQFVGYSDRDRESAISRAMGYRTWFQANKRNVTKANVEFCMLDIGPDYFTRMVFLLAVDGLLTGRVLREIVDRLWVNVRHSGPLSLEEWARLYVLAHGPNNMFGRAWDPNVGTERSPEVDS